MFPVCPFCPSALAFTLLAEGQYKNEPRRQHTSSPLDLFYLFSDSGEARGAAGKDVIKSIISYSETRLNMEEPSL